jgi:hypothetical protein
VFFGGVVAGYRFSVQKAVSRGKGQSAVAKAAYNAREQLHDDRSGQFTRDYGKPTKGSGGKDDVLFTGIFLDTKLNPPEWTANRNSMWNAAVGAEKRKDAREAQEIIVNLPWELSQKQREYMLTDFCREITRGTGRIADVNMHKAPKHGDDRNVHAHILLTVREISSDGFTGKRFEILPDQIEQWKEKWAARGARELRKAGFPVEADRWAVGHLTKEKQYDAALKRLDLEHAAALTGSPTKHLGPQAAAMERSGKGSDRGDVRRGDKASEGLLVRLKRRLAHVEKKIFTAILALRRETRAGGEKQLEPEQKASPPLTKAAKLAEAVRLFLVTESRTSPEPEKNPGKNVSQEPGKNISQKPPDQDRER